jgi:hypothetical protein
MSTKKYAQRHQMAGMAGTGDKNGEYGTIIVASIGEWKVMGE